MGVFPFIHPCRLCLRVYVRNGIKRLGLGSIIVGGRRVRRVVLRRSNRSPLRLRCSMIVILSSMCELSLPYSQPWIIISTYG
jgi:hypothetical protein